MLIKASHDADKTYVMTDSEIVEQKGRETIYTVVAGEKPQTLVQPKIFEASAEIQRWQTETRRREDEFQRKVMGDVAIIQTIPSKGGEREIWESLKRAHTAAEVRRAYSRSKIWLKSRVDLPKGGLIDWSWSPYPRELYRRAKEFCDSKLDDRYPGRDSRPTGDYRRIEYLARVMAGYSLVKPISWSYSVETLRKLKHSRICACWRCENKIAPRYQRSLVEFLITHPF